MKNTKLTIDLGNADLTDEQKQNILAAVHKAVNTKVKSPGGTKAAGLTAAATPPKTFNLHADFLNTDPGLSELDATINGQKQTLTESGDLTFTNIPTPRILTVSGKSLGTTNISFSVPAKPATKSFQPGTFVFNFIIL